MSVIFHRLDTDALEFQEIGRVNDGEIVAGTDYLESVLLDADLAADDATLVDRFDGPVLYASPGPGQTTKADTTTEWIPYEGPLGGEGWQNVNDPDDIRYIDEPPGPVADGVDLDGDDTELEPVEINDLELGDDVVIEWNHERDTYTLDDIWETPSEGPAGDTFVFMDESGETLKFKRYQFNNKNFDILDLVGRLTPQGADAADDVFEIEGITVEAVGPDDILEGDEVILDTGDERGEVAVSILDINTPLTYFYAEDDSGGDYTIGWEPDVGNYSWDSDVMGRIVPEADQTYEDSGFEIKPKAFEEIEVGDELLVTLDGEKTTVAVHDIKGFGDYRRLFIETNNEWDGILSPMALEQDNYEYHGEIMGVAGDDENAERYIDGVPVSDPPEFEAIGVDDRLFVRDVDGNVREGRIEERFDAECRLILDNGEDFWFYDEDYPEGLVNTYADPPEGEDFPQYEVIAERLPGDTLREYEVDGHTIQELDPQNSGAALEPGDTFYWEGLDGENYRAYLMDVESQKSGDSVIVGMTEDGRRLKAAQSEVYGDIPLRNVHGKITNEDGHLPPIDDERVTEWGRTRIGRQERRFEVRDAAKTFVTDMFRVGASADAIRTGIDAGIDAGESDDVRHMDRETVYRDAAEDALKRFGDFPVEEWGADFNLGKVSGDLRNEFIDRWEKAASPDEISTIRDNISGWSGYETMMDQETAAFWQTAFDEYQNNYVAENANKVKNAPVGDAEKEAFRKYRDRVVDLYVEAFGPEGGVPDPDDVDAEEAAVGDRVELRDGGSGRIVWADSDWVDIQDTTRDDETRVTEYAREDIATITDTRGRVTIPVFKGVRGTSSRVAKLGDEIRAGKTVELKQMALDSWSTSPGSAWDFARGNGFVIRKQIPVTDIWATCDTTKSLLDRENEVILGHDETHLRLDDEDVHFTDQKTPFHDIEWALDSLRDRGVMKADTRPSMGDMGAQYDFTSGTWDWLKVVALRRKHLRENQPRGNVRRKSLVNVADLPVPERGISESTLAKAGANVEQVDNTLMEAIEKQVWTEINEIEKAPNMWRRSDNVPQYIRTFVKEAALDMDTMYDDFNDIPHMAALKVHSIIYNQLTDPDGWSIKSIRDELTDEFEGMDEKRAETITRTEVAAVLNKARELAYTESTVNPDVYWSGPDDHRTTDLCTEVKEEIESADGYVKLDDLKSILMRKARKYRADGGTPERVDEFVPHFSCRHTFVRAEYRFLN